MVSCLPGDDAKLYRYKALVSRGVGGGALARVCGALRLCAKAVSESVLFAT